MKLPVKNIKKCLSVAVLFLLCAGCSAGGIYGQSVKEEVWEEETTVKEPAPQEPAKEEIPQPGEQEEEERYPERRKELGQAALVTGTSPVMDGGYNQAAYEGLQSYAQSAGVVYSYYSAAYDSLEGYEEAVLTAIESGARLIVCAGSYFEQAVGSLQDQYQDVYFLLLDGVPKDGSGNAVDIGQNVHCIVYDEEEAGYLAGYMTVLEGYTRLGFIGGRPFPSVCRYGYGYVQGIDDAAAYRDISDEIRIDYWYADTFLPNEQVEKRAYDWYMSGTEVIFVCGGSLYESVLAGAESCGGRLIGADVDQSGISELFLTSAVKGVKASVIIALDDFYAYGGTWSGELAGKVIAYGAEKKCIELPFSDEAWRFEHVSADDYFQILADLKTGKIHVSDKIDIFPETTVPVIYHNE